jgi:hypothetical protein
VAAAEYLYGKSCCLSFKLSLVAEAKGSGMSHHKLFSQMLPHDVKIGDQAPNWLVRVNNSALSLTLGPGRIIS